MVGYGKRIKFEVSGKISNIYVIVDDDDNGGGVKGREEGRRKRGRTTTSEQLKLCNCHSKGSTAGAEGILSG